MHGSSAPKLVGLSQGDPNVPRTASGVAKFLCDALARQNRIVARHSVDLSPWQKRLIAAWTFHPNWDEWRSRLYWHRGLALEVRSRNSARALAGVGVPFDLVLQIFGLFHTRGSPYVIYTDSTVELSHRFWPPWAPADVEKVFSWERELFHEANHIFTMGRRAATSLVDFYGVPSDRVTAVGGGANFESLPELTPVDRDPLIIFVGRAWDRKGGDVLVEAFREVRERLPAARLQIIGTDHRVDEPGVDVLGEIKSRDHLAALYEQAAVFCMPSHFEPYGLALVEAMTYGLPCVSTRVGGIPDIVIDGKTGLLCSPGDPTELARALLATLEGPAYARELGAAGRRRVEQELNWDAVAGRMISTLERIASDGSGPVGA